MVPASWGGVGEGAHVAAWRRAAASLGPHLRGDEREEWVPACAGMSGGVGPYLRGRRALPARGRAGWPLPPTAHSRAGGNPSALRCARAWPTGRWRSTSRSCYPPTKSPIEAALRGSPGRGQDGHQRTQDHPDPAVLVGKPIIRGTRIPVELVLGLLADGWTEAAILDSYPHLTRADIQACLAYARLCKEQPRRGEKPLNRAAIDALIRRLRRLAGPR